LRGPTPFRNCSWICSGSSGTPAILLNDDGAALRDVDRLDLVRQIERLFEADAGYLRPFAEQYRTDYLFYAATSWQANFVDIIAPKGASVKVDGVNVANWKGIGNSGFDIAHVQLANNGNGTHTVSGDQKVGISVYGLQSYGSYWYPGGLDLDLIPQ